jgi:hypothetical protein
MDGTLPNTSDEFFTANFTAEIMVELWIFYASGNNTLVDTPGAENFFTVVTAV